MPNQTAKSHKSRKTETPGKPRRSEKATADAAPADITPSPSPVESPSSLVPATTASEPPRISSVEDAKDFIESKVDTGIPNEKPAEKQPWYRPPTSPLRKQAEKITVMVAAGHDYEAIAKKLKTTAKNVKHVMYIARKNGWLDENDEPVDIEAEMALNLDKKVVRNMSATLDGQMTNWQTHEMTMALVKRRVKDVNADAASGMPQVNVVAIRIDMPALGAEDQGVVEANVGGVPAYVEGEVVGDGRLLPAESAGAGPSAHGCPAGEANPGGIPQEH